MTKKAIIIGAGPAGLTAAYELLKRTDIIPVILEKSGDIGGISKTVNYKGNRIDIGGHRFFSKSDRVMNWWRNIMPVQTEGGKYLTVTYQCKSKTITTEQSALKENEPDKVMLVRRRLSRIYFLRKFFTYPIQLSLDTLKKLGVTRTAAILISYLRARLLLRKPQNNLEDFFISRFGDKLYRLFFKDYTEKVWGVPCTEISAEWGAQRIKGISIAKAMYHALKSFYPKKSETSGDIAQKGIETSLIENFLYPKFGPGQLWEEVARQIVEMGGEIHMNLHVLETEVDNDKVIAVSTKNSLTNDITQWKGDYFFSTMPVQELIAGIGKKVPVDVQEVAKGLQYRDFITVGILLRKMDLPDTWIYIQERDVKVGRLQIFNNWSPYMVKDPDTVWVGMEYFCNKGDGFWELKDEEIQAIAIGELTKMGLVAVEDVLDSTVLRMEKTYPAYFGAYNRFDEIREYTDKFKNLFLVGRNGMHKYNNSDHSMLTAMVAVDNIERGIISKENIWSINTEQEYHEEKQEKKDPPAHLQGPEPGNKMTNTSKPLKIPPLVEKSNAYSFSDYLFRDKNNKWYRWITLLGIIIQFAIFKTLYPFAGFISGDSYVYLQTAYWNWNINIYPVGYSKFLRIFSTFTVSDTALVAFQYLCIQTAALYLLFTLFYRYRPQTWVKITLFILTVFNPVFLYLSNYISSDALFLSLSLIWFTQLIWIIEKPSPSRVILHTLILFVAFTFRYNAMFYPLIAALAFALSPQRLWKKIIGLGINIIVLGCFMLTTMSSYKKLTGIREFTPFSGWQMANNAMYAYREVKNKDTINIPGNFRDLDRTIRIYFDSTRNTKTHPTEMLRANTVYMWSPQSPLQRFMEDRFRGDKEADPIKKWAVMAPLYGDYGSWLIKKYPLSFIENYLWPNSLKYYAPPVEFLQSYNMGLDTVRTIAKVWFRYRDNKVRTAFKDFNINVLNLYPILSGAINIIFLASITGIIFLQGFKKISSYKDILLLGTGLWIINYVFSVFASPIALRFQLFPVFVYLFISLLLIDKICKLAISK